jgi:dipeptidyl aminopeptidase/acylaminoacyl peptidase
LTRLSPDGTRISYLAPLDGVLNVWVAPADDPDNARAITHDSGRGIRMYLWAYTNHHILYLQDKDGDENWRVYSVDLRSDQVRELTPFEEVNAQLHQVSHHFPHEILVGLNDRNPQLHDIYRINIESGERHLLQQNDDGFAGFLSDDTYTVRFALRMLPDGSEEVVQRSSAGAWEPFLTIPMQDSITTSPIGFDKHGGVLYLIDSRNRDTSAMTLLDLTSGEQTTIADDPRADVSGVIIHPTERQIQGVAFTYERKQWHILDSAIEADIAYLRTVADGDIEVASRTLDDSTWIVAYLMDNGPIRYYHYQRERKEARFLFSNRKALEQYPLCKMHPVVIPARDGLHLVSYYTLPLHSHPADATRPDAPLPMVLLVHGGPWARDMWGYHTHHQLLANRGYAVLSVNFRGSTGFGKAFINASIHEWGARMHDDLIDAVEWAVREGIADPQRIAIMGGSYGGYATLVGLTFTPERFTCGIDIVGPSNLITLLETIPPYWMPMFNMWATRVGNPRTEEGQALLRERSPLTYVDRIQKPLLIGQGANDPRVKQSESDQIVQAMQEKHIPVTYVLYPDEGHGFARPENSLSFFAIVEAFLARCLGGRYEPVGDDFKGASLKVVTGGDDVPGLPEALSA